MNSNNFSVSNSRMLNDILNERVGQELRTFYFLSSLLHVSQKCSIAREISITELKLFEFKKIDRPIWSPDLLCSYNSS